MKRIKEFVLSLSVLLIIALPIGVFAAGATSGGLQSGGTNGTESTATKCVEGKLCNPIAAGSINELVGLIMRAIIDIGSIVAVFFVIFAGFKFVKAQGNPDAIADAQKTLMYTLIGIAVLFGAQLIAALITNTVKSVGSGVL